MLESYARYLSLIADLFPLSQRVNWHTLLEMLNVNTQESLGSDWESALDGLQRYEVLVAGRPCTAIDGRMLPHEWIHTQQGLVKIDALHHHCDHFFPQCQDIAWDIAGTIAECGLNSDGAEFLVSRLSEYRGDAELSLRLPFYRCAYLAYRTGYVSLCFESMHPCPEKQRFASQLDFYRAALRVAIREATGFQKKCISLSSRSNDKGSDPAPSPAVGTLVP